MAERYKVTECVQTSLHTEPSFTAPVVCMLPADSYVDGIDGYDVEDGFLYVRTVEDEIEGYTCADYLTKI